MRPRLQVLEPPLISSIVDEAKRILDEVGMEIRGKDLRARLLEHGLPTTAECPSPEINSSTVAAPAVAVWVNVTGDPARPGALASVC